MAKQQQLEQALRASRADCADLEQKLEAAERDCTQASTTTKEMEFQVDLSSVMAAARVSPYPVSSGAS